MTIPPVVTNPSEAPLVCILSDGDGPTLKDATASAQRFGLAVLIGLSAGTQRGSQRGVGADGAERVGIAWRDDFADARNQLSKIAHAHYAQYPYLLWLDSDEELVAWPARDWRAEKAAWFSV